MLRSTSAPDLLGGDGISSKESWSPSPSDSASCLDGLVLSAKTASVTTTPTYINSHSSTTADISNTAPATMTNSSLLPALPSEPMSSPTPLPTIESDHRLCANCQTKQTPFWRRAGDGQFYCNACGLYLRAHNRMRPVALQATRQSKRIKNRVDSCSNCQAKDTPLWRRLNTGETVCNACGLYYKLHGSHRPVYAVKAATTTSLGRKPRIILPKYLHGETSWHQYLPPPPPSHSHSHSHSNTHTHPSPASSSPGATAAAAAAANLMMMTNMVTGSMPVSGTAAATALLGSFGLGTTTVAPSASATDSVETSNSDSSRSAAQYRHSSLFKHSTEIDPRQLLLSTTVEGSTFMLANSARGMTDSARGNGSSSSSSSGPLLYDGSAGRVPSLSTTGSFLPAYPTVSCSASTSSALLDESSPSNDSIRVGVGGTQVPSHQHHHQLHQSHNHHLHLLHYHSQRPCQQQQCRQPPNQSHLLDYSLTWFNK